MRRPIGPQQPAAPRGLEPVTIGAATKPRAQDVGDALASWMASGSSWFPRPVEPPGQQPPPLLPGEWPIRPPESEYGQIVCAYYVPRGAVAWVHDIEIAPYMSPGLFLEPDPAVSFAKPFRPGGQASYGWHWQTGPVWEGWAPAVAGVRFAPAWRWAVMACANNLYRRRSVAPPVGLPVPVAQIDRIGLQATYRGQLPNGDVFSRVPLVGAARGSEASWNIQVAEDTTICLVVKGRNTVINPDSINGLASSMPVAPFAGSFGRLRGYQQQTQTDAARRNASRGLGS